MFNIFRDTIAKDLSKIADYFNGVADAGTVFKDKRALAVNRIKNAVLNGDIGGGGGVTPEIEAEIENAQWKTETSTPLFSETVTTVDQSDVNSATLTYSTAINSDPLIVTFDDVKYICPKNTGGGTYYGASYDISTGKFDFTDFPFQIRSITNEVSGNIINLIATETAGEHTVVVVSETTNYTDAFKIGVNANIFKEVENISEADAVLVYFPNRVFVNIPIVDVEGDTTTANVSIIPNGYKRQFSGTFLFLKSYPSGFTCGTLTLYEEDGNNILICEPNRVVENSGSYTFSFSGNAFLNLSEVSNVVIRYYKIGVPSIDVDNGGIG